jgi:DNA-binding NarL/FixJ family response regulator
MSVTERSNAAAPSAFGAASAASTLSEAVVVHRNPLLRAGLVAALSPFFRARDGAESQPPAASVPERPPLIVADHEGALAMLAAAATQPRRGGMAPAHWLVIGPVSHGGRVRDAMSAGVLGYVHAACSVEELRDAARAVAAGRRYLCRTAAGLIAEGWLGDDLTPREHDVLRMLCTGLDNKSIGQRLGVAPGTVKTHVKTLLQKLGARSRTQAATEALRRGLIEGSAMDDPFPLPPGCGAWAAPPVKSRGARANPAP